MCGFCMCSNIKRVPGYKETEPDVQFMDNYPDNRISLPALIRTCIYTSSAINPVYTFTCTNAPSVI